MKSSSEQSPVMVVERSEDSGEREKEKKKNKRRSNRRSKQNSPIPGILRVQLLIVFSFYYFLPRLLRKLQVAAMIFLICNGKKEEGKRFVFWNFLLSCSRRIFHQDRILEKKNNG
ncbi:hypothetical protein OIU79_015478 [Salix purpurea]|uniref:Uncharacterized protein n=1 Tax=Salix purpurea TaxID=77065 RepID=A0A9Q0SQ90_SALPP|nr:hypothetical protein OIU79_015478 [Salix purpurea]